MHIAICDDDRVVCMQTAAMVRQRCCVRLGQVPVLSIYFAAEEVLASEEEFDLYLLDILMPGGNGIDLAVALHSKHPKARIVFLTNSPQFAVDAYRVRAEDYLLKPLVAEALDSVLINAATVAVSCLSIPTQDGDVLLPYHHVIYVENGNHVLTYYLTDQSKLHTRTLRESFVESVGLLLMSPYFFQCHRSFVVNARQVYRLEEKSKQLYLIDGTVLPVSRTRLLAVRGALMDCLTYGAEEES